MKYFSIALALIAILAVSVYVSLTTWSWSWAAVSVTALLGLIGMYVCWHRARYAALFAAIDILLLTNVGPAIGRVTATFESSVFGTANLSVSLNGPSQWPSIVGAAILLLYQTCVEFVERKGSLHFFRDVFVGGAKTNTPGSSAVVGSTVEQVISAQVGEGTSGNVAIGQNIKQVQFNAEVDSEIQNAADLLDADRIRSAEEALTRIQKRYGSDLTPYQRYRVLANLGHVNARKRNTESAATFYKRAADIVEDDELAAVCRALAAAIQGDDGDALNLSLKVLNTNATNATAAGIRIECDHTSTTTRELLSAVNEEVAEAETVLFACISREARNNRFVEAEAFAREAFNKHATRPTFDIQIAESIVADVSSRFGHEPHTEFLPLTEKDRLRDAITRLTSVLGNSQIELTEERIAGVRTTRGLANSLLGNSEQALDDWDAAASMSKSVDSIILPYAVKLCEAGRVEQAIAALERANSRFDDIMLAGFYSHLLSDRNASNDRLTAESTLRKAFERDRDKSSSTTMIGLMTLVDLESLSTAESVSQYPSMYKQYRDRLTPFADRVVLAHRAVKQQDVNEANMQIGMAFLNWHTSNDVREKRQLALVSRALGRLSESAWIMSKCTTLARGNDCIPLLFQFAMEAKLDWLYLEHARLIRSNGIFIEEVVKNEAIKLAQYYMFNELSELLEDAERQRLTTDTLQWIRYTRSIAAVHVGILDLVESDPSLLPIATALNPKELPNFKKVMEYGPGREVAISQLYDLVRRDRSAPEPAMAFLAACQLGEDSDADAGFEHVCPGSAVLVDRGNGNTEWYVIEDGANADLSHNEFPVQHTTVAPLLGKSIGESVTYTHGFETSQLVVKKIIDKHAYLTGRIMETFPEMHPDSTFLFRFTIPHKPDGTPDFRVLGVQMNFWKASTDEKYEFYRQNLIPLVSLASLVHRPIAAVWWHIVEAEQLPIRVTQGSAEEVKNASKSFESKRSFVLTPSAAMTLLYTSVWKELTDKGIDVVVPAALLNDIWSLIADFPFNEDGFRTAGDLPYVEKRSIEDWGRHRWRVGQFLMWLKQKCTVVDCSALARIRVEVREHLIRMVGMSCASAIAVAAERNGCLWTDDFAVAVLGREHGVPYRVWTLSVVGTLADSDRFEKPKCQDLACDLIAFGYCNILLDGVTFERAGRRSRWDPREFPLSGMCRWFANPEIRAEIHLRVLSQSLRALHKQNLLAHQEEGVLNAIFEALTRRPDGKNLANAVLSQLGTMFRFEPMFQQSASRIIRKWIDIPSH